MSDNEKPSFESPRPTLVLNSESAAADPMQAAEARMRRALGLDGEQLRPRPAPERVEPSQPRPAERFVPGGHKRRFVHDGEVPVTVVHGLVSGRRDHHDGNGRTNGAPTNRLEIAEAALTAEIANRERIERALQEAQATVRDLRTKLGHADLARQEAVEAAQREHEAAEASHVALLEAQAELSAVQQSREAAERAMADLQAALELKANPPPPLEIATPDLPARPRRGRKPRRAIAAAEPPPAAPKPARTAAKKSSSATPKPRQSTRRAGTKKAASAREPKPIRWWVAPRGKTKAKASVRKKR